MSLSKTSNRQVNPTVAAVAIILVLAVVQYYWWHGLIAKTRVNSGPRAMSSGGPMPSVLILKGLVTANVDTLAGYPAPGNTDGIGRDARFDGPAGLAIDSSGDIFVADSRNCRIRVVSPDGRTRTLAGSVAGFLDGPAQVARFNAPSGVALAADGSVYVADTNNHRIRRVRGGEVTTIAGADAGMMDGSASQARFNVPTSLAIMKDAGGETLLVADSGNRRVRRVHINSQPPTVETLRTEPGIPTGINVGAGTVGADTIAVAVPESGMIDIGTGTIKGLLLRPGDPGDDPNDGSIKFGKPVSAFPCPDGWYVVDAEHAALLRVRGAEAQVLAGSCWKKGPIWGYHDDTGARAGFGALCGIVADGKRHVYVADSTNNAIRRITLPEPGAEARPSRRERWRPE